MLKYKAIIFDLDGVICHTDKYHYKAWKQLADDLKIVFNEQINNRLRGVSRMESLDIILENYNGALTLKEKQEFAETKNDIYKQLLVELSRTDLSLEVKSTLDYLRGLGIILAIGSSSKNAKFILKRIGLENYFDAISDGNNITKSKPDPQVFLVASDMINISPIDCLVVEDALSGLQASISANMHCVAIGGEAVKCGLATYNIETFYELKDIFKD